MRPTAWMLLALPLALVSGCSDGPSAPASAPDGSSAALRPVDGVGELLDEFAPTVLEADLSKLDERERAVLGHLVGASRGVQAVFLRQANRENPGYRRALERIPGARGETVLALFDLHCGVYERHRGWAAFVVGVPPRPAGGGLYPPDLTPEEWKGFLAARPDREAELISLTTAVVRREAELAGIPYSQAYADEVTAIREQLGRAAHQTRDEALARHLRALRDALASDDYRAADVAWLETEGPLELTLGPHETDEDELFGLKAAFSSRVTVVDAAAQARADGFASRLDELHGLLPLSGQARRLERSRGASIRCADLVHSAGFARAGLQTTAYNLPNDELVREISGARTVVLGNVIRAKFATILRPIAARVLEDGPARLPSQATLWDLVLFHELCHGVGPGRTLAASPGAGARVREVLLETHPVLDELKADLAGLWIMLELETRGELEHGADALVATHVAELFRIARLGTASPRGTSAAIQFRMLRENGAVIVGPDGRLRIATSRVRDAVRRALGRVLELHARGDREAAHRLIEAQGSVPPEMRALLGRIDDLPLDLRPVFPIAGERLKASPTTNPD